MGQLLFIGTQLPMTCPQLPPDALVCQATELSVNGL
jgi:hypothetical protein